MTGDAVVRQAGMAAMLKDEQNARRQWGGPSADFPYSAIALLRGYAEFYSGPQWGDS